MSRNFLPSLSLPPFLPLLLPTTHLSVAKQHESVEHVEDLQARLVDGEDDSAFGVSQFV